MVSPVSLSLALGMAYNGTDGDTKTAFEQVLNYNSSIEEVNYTTIKPFIKPDSEIIDANMMTMTENIEYMQNELFSSVILPYEKDKFSMVILLPNCGKTTDDIIAELSMKQWNSWLDTYESDSVTVTMPKIKLEYENMLNDELIDMGLGVVFTPQADFSKISSIALMIDYVLQKTFIDVNEEGTEAAAVTIVGFEYTSIDSHQPINFTVNKPFIYAIKENVTSSICFMGKVGEPKYEE
jgi:serpin B